MRVSDQQYYGKPGLAGPEHSQSRLGLKKDRPGEPVTELGFKQG
jgi:hypothetical protein